MAAPARRNSVLAAVLALAAWVPARGAVYYVDSAGGSDQAAGLSPASPWRTLARVSAAQFAPGDTVLLRRGRVWNECLVWPSSGSDDLPVHLGAWGNGAPPVIDGQGVVLSDGQGLVDLSRRSNVTLFGLDIRRSNGIGLHVYSSTGVRIRDVAVHENQRHGILIFDSERIVVEDSDIWGNSLETSSMWAGIRIDGKGGVWRDFLIRSNRIHDNVGGAGWNSANGIMLGHTGPEIPVLQMVRISGNEIYANGNPEQNQAGRGISASCEGDVSVTGNTVRQNASAGIYLGDTGLTLDIEISNNFFYNNALRQFGGITAGKASASRNTAVVDDPGMTAMGAEIGGPGQWTLTENVFYYLSRTDDTWRGFIRINDPAQERNLRSDFNLFISPGPVRWKTGSGDFVSFAQWKALGFDTHSVASPPQ